jgi:transcriptional regulator with XRE-family HTH domain
MISQSQVRAHPLNTSPATYPPLKYQRLLRGWTQRDVADELYKLCIADGRPDAGINADIVGNWERGRRPSLFYQKYLVKLYGLTTAQLGLLDAKGGRA